MQEFHTYLSIKTIEEYIEISKHTERTQYQLIHKYATRFCYFITISRKTIFDEIMSSIAARTQKI